MRRLLAILSVLALALPPLPALAQDTNALSPSAGNAVLPTARDNIAANPGFTSWRTPMDFGAKCDVVNYSGAGASIAITAGTNVLSIGGVTFTSADIGKKVLMPGQGAGGGVLSTTISGLSGANATLAANAVAGTTTQFALSAVIAAAGTGYAPADTITLTGGTATTNAILTVKTTKVAVAPTINAAGSGGSDGAYWAYGTTGNGNRVVLNVTVAGGAVTAINSIIDGGHYLTNPTSLAAEPISGWNTQGGTFPTGATIVLTAKMGVDQVLPTTPGIYSVFPGSPVAQGSTSGGGSGATFTVTNAFNNAVSYGTDDQAAFLAASNWAAGQLGGEIRLPAKICGLASTWNILGNSTRVTGTAALGPNGVYRQGQAPIYAGGQGSVLQWLGASGGTMINIVSTTTPSGSSIAGFGNSIEGVSFSCAIPNTTNTGLPSPLAGIGLRLTSQIEPLVQRVAFEECSIADLQTTTFATGSGTGTVNTQAARIQDIRLYNVLGYDGIGIDLQGRSDGTADTDYWTIRNIEGSILNSPGVNMSSLDNGSMETVHFITNPGGTAYGVDINGLVYGSSQSPQNGDVRIRGLDASSIIRGKESVAVVPSNIIIDGFDPGNGIAPTVLRPGYGGTLNNASTISWRDYNGRFAPTLITQKPTQFVGVPLDMLLMKHDNGNSAYEFYSDANRHGHEFLFDTDGATIRGFRSDYFATGISPNNYITSGGLQIGGTLSDNLSNGGYGIRVATGPTNGAYAADGSTSGTAVLSACATGGTWCQPKLTDAINQETHVSTATLSKTDTNLASFTGLSQSLTAAGLYSCNGYVHFTTAPTGSNGFKIALATSDTLTVNQMVFFVTALNAAAFVASGTGTSTALGTAADNVLAAATDLILHAIINVNAAGTLQVQLAENTASGTIAVLAGNARWDCHRAA